MSRFGMHTHLGALADTALPSLRVIGMAYTGLIGIVAVVLVVSVAFLPVPPAVQGATQPAREVIGSLVLPATDAVASLVGLRTELPQPVFQFVPVPRVALARELPSTVVDVVLGDMTLPTASEPPVTTDAPAASRVAVARVAPEAVAESPDPVAEDVPVDEPEQAVEARDRAPVQQIVLAESPVQQAANVDAPKPLAPLPSPTETAWQTKARLDAENQAAIDASKASLARLKAEADVANQAAIDAGKAAAATFVPTPRPTAPADVARTTPTDSPAAPTTVPQTRAAANADNQALIDAARVAAAHAKSDANAANQAAIDAARAPKPAATAASKPTSSPAPPAPPAPAPTPLPLPLPTSPTVIAPDAASTGAVDEQPLNEDEAPIMLALDAPEV